MSVKQITISQLVYPSIPFTGANVYIWAETYLGTDIIGDDVSVDAKLPF